MHLLQVAPGVTRQPIQQGLRDTHSCTGGSRENGGDSWFVKLFVVGCEWLL